MYGLVAIPRPSRPIVPDLFEALPRGETVSARQSLRVRYAKIAVSGGLCRPDFGSRGSVLDGEVRAFSLLLNRYSRSTGIPARTRAKAAAGCGTQKCQCCEWRCF